MSEDTVFPHIINARDAVVKAIKRLDAAVIAARSAKDVRERSLGDAKRLLGSVKMMIDHDAIAKR